MIFTMQSILQTMLRNESVSQENSLVSKWTCIIVYYYYTTLPSVTDDID